MQTKIFAAILTVVSLTSVDAAVLPRATLTPGLIILPEVVFNPVDLISPPYTALNIFRNDLFKTTTLIADLTRAAGTTVKDRTDQVNAVIRQVTANIGNIRTRTGWVISNLQGVVPAGIPAPTGTGPAPATPTAEPLQVAQDLVRQAQALARTATAQLQTLQALTDAADIIVKAAYTVAYTQARLALEIALTTIASTGTALIEAAANALDNVNGASDRVRSVKYKLTTVLVIGTTQDVAFTY
ncbi:hypothetical protein LX32DRAFT_698873 [Colletotrichum zoysiae]|uniref:Cell wall protein n=1 Tax=Colletotrichum zoysiae TaxID=1216348 RepID=A0AAD9LVK4_9PEZI|nr:hypothetical protein LX32DRAFT_698873 [Colletotrichum zoysiae]